MSATTGPADGPTLARTAYERIMRHEEAPIVLGSHRSDRASLLRIARLVAHVHPDPHRPIGVFCDLSPDGWLFMIAAVASGRPIVALDSHANRELNSSRIKAAGCCAFLAVEQIPSFSQQFDLPWIDSEATCDEPVLEVAADDPCLICFTSGSTGKPRCHARTQYGQWFIGFSRSEFRGLKGADHRILLCMSPAFIGVMNNMAESLVSNGAAVVLPARLVSPERLLEEVDRFQVAMVSLVPTMLRNLIRVSGTTGFPASLRGINVSGEVMSCSDLRSWKKQLPESVAIYLSYGSTESGTLMIHVPSTDTLEGHGPVPLGKPLPGIDLAIVDDAGQPVPPGESGALLIRNPGMAVPFPHGGCEHLESLPQRGDGWFPMGDHGFLDSAGDLVVLGRTDGEVKVDGLRFDPMACESSIRSLEGVDDAALVLVEYEERTRPVAFVRAGPEHLEAIRIAARSSGPVGDRVLIELCDVLPELITSKVDRSALADRALELLDGSRAPAHGIQPRSRTEQVIQDVWVNHLKIPQPSVNRTFLELGGNSLAFLGVMLDLKERYRIEFPPDQVAHLDTIERQANGAIVRPPCESEEVDPLVPFHEVSESDSAVLLLPGVGGHVWAFKPLAQVVGTDLSVAGLDWCKCPDLPRLVESVSTWAGDRRLVIVGFSGGSRVAGKLASILETRGMKIQRLLILDGPPRDGLSHRIKRLLRPLFDRKSTAGHAVDQYLSEYTRQGVRFYPQCTFKSLKAPVVLITTRGQSCPLPAQWSRHASVTTRHLTVDHLELVKYPIPPEVVEAVRGGLGMDR